MKTDSYIEPYLVRHSIIGVEKGRQGMAQTIPQGLVLCFTCGWMVLSDYHDHIVTIVDDYIKDIL